MATLRLGLLTLLLFATLAGAHFATSHSHAARLETRPAETPLTRRLDAIAQRISGRKDVWVRCGVTSDPSILGSVMFYGGRPGNQALLAPVICDILARFASGAEPSLACTQLGGGSCPPAVVQLAWATSALAHESTHLGGVRNEAAAECYGLQRTAVVAEALGASPQYAQQLADYTFWNVRPPVDAGYFSPECRDGGALDLHPDSPVWP